MDTDTLLIKAPDGTKYAISKPDLAAFRLTQEPFLVRDPDGDVYAIPRAELERFAVPAGQSEEVEGYGDPWSFRDPDVGNLAGQLGIKDPPKFFGPTTNTTSTAPTQSTTETWSFSGWLSRWFCP